MESVNVLVISSISEQSLRQIAAVSPRIKLSDASNLWDAPDMVTAERKGDISNEKFDALLAQAEVIYGFRPPQNVIARAPKLKWIQTMLAGVDHILDNDIVQSPVILTNTSGIHGTPVSEVVFMMMLMFAKEAPSCFQLKQRKQWKRFIPALLHSKTVGIVGLGSIGKEVARLAKTFGMRVIATHRSAKRVTRARYVDTVLPREQLPVLLSESDFVVLILPLTPETNKLIGERELRTMKSTAYLINVGRGSTVDEEALIHALDEHRIAGAGLDAYTTEPLPTESRLWELPNVIISPHVAGRLETYTAVTTDLFCKNLRRYLSGQKLPNVVDKKRGY